MSVRFLPIEIDVGSPISAVTFSADSKHLLSGCEKGVQIWRLGDEKKVATLEAKNVTCLAVSPDGRWIAAGELKGAMFVWDAETYEQVIKHGGNFDMRDIDFSPDSMRLVAALGNRVAGVENLATRRRIQTLDHGDLHWVLIAKYSQKGDRIVTVTSVSTPNERLRVWDSSDGSLLIEVSITITPHYNGGLLWLNDRLLFICHDTIQELDATSGRVVSQWPVDRSGYLSSITLLNHGTCIAYTRDSTVTFFDTLTHSQLGRIRHHELVRPIAISSNDRFIALGGPNKKITVQGLSALNYNSSIPFSHLYPLADQQPDIQIHDTALDFWMRDQLKKADTLLTFGITTSQSNSTHHVLASRALVRARLKNWDAALVDAEKAINIKPSVIGYVAKSLAHVGKGERHKAYRACDIAFEYFHSSHVTFFLLVKAVIVFMAGEHVDAMSRIDDLIETVHHNSICYVIQAYMHLLLGRLCMERCDYEGAIESFEHARDRIKPHSSQILFVISLISGWKFDDLDVTVRQCLCEALYSTGRITDAGESLLEFVRILGDKGNMHDDVTNWISDFSRQCLSTLPPNDVSPYADPTSLLTEWAKATLISQSWKDALLSSVAFIAPRFTVYRALYECLEAIGRITDATECLLEMASELIQENDNEETKGIVEMRYWCTGKLEDLGDNAMSARQHDQAIIQYSTALSFGPAYPHRLFAKRSQARANMGLWMDALHDANQVITLDPSSPLGYERQHAALRGAGCYADAELAFEAMLLRMSQSADLEMRERSRQYIKPAQTEEVIRRAIQNSVRETPLVLINTKSGHLLDKAGQASSFESLPIFHELVSSMTTEIDHIRIENEVGPYYRYATFSHKWKENEPLYDKVLQIVVYELEESPTHTKLQMFCKIAREAGLHWAWSDTCCINKADPSVLQEALVSMFQWYQCSTMTVVLLCDVPLKRLGDSTWNSRAWTFQEYHASKVVRFYNKDWTPYRNLDVPNHKEVPEIIAEMEEATGVSAQALMALRPGLEDIREKLRLASTRQTTRVEDAAYSLLGIFSLSMSAVYGEGDKALGRLLAQLLTSSGDTNILAWTGKSGGFNSCLPARIAVFSQLPTSHIPPVLTDTDMESSTAALRELDLASVTRFYDQLSELRVPSFTGKRMSLPCIVFKLGPFSVSRSGPEQLFRAQTDAVGIVEIKTGENLSRFKSLYLVHPWIDFLLDRQPVGSVIETIPEESTDDLSLSLDEPSSCTSPPSTTSAAAHAPRGMASRVGLSFRRRSSIRSPDVASLHSVPETSLARVASYSSLRPPSTLTEADRQTRALQVIARMRRPFGALLLTPDPGNVAAYRRVAAETLITVQVQEMTQTVLDKLTGSVRMVDVL